MVDAVLNGFGSLPVLAWCSAGLAALAVLGLVRPPADRLRYATTGRRPGSGTAGAGPLDWLTGWRDGPPGWMSGRRDGPPGWLTGRRDGPSLARRLVLGTVAATGLCLAGSALAPAGRTWLWLAWPLLAALAAGGLGLLEPGAVRARRERVVADTPQALDLLAACLAAGMPARLAGRAVVEAFEGPVGENLARVLALADLGVPEAEAWRSLAGHPQLGPAAVDLSRSVDSGTLMVTALERHATTAREARRSGLVVRARSVGVRSVLPLMTCFIPAFLLLGVVPTVASALAAALG